MFPLSLFEANRNDEDAVNSLTENPKHLELTSDDAYICATCEQHISHTHLETKMLGRFEHTFANPHGYFFTVGCFSDAPGCLFDSESSTEFSWFAGYSWQIAHCIQCNSHLGWHFENDAFAFWALILNRLRHRTHNSLSH